MPKLQAFCKKSTDIISTIVENTSLSSNAKNYSLANYMKNQLALGIIYNSIFVYKIGV